MFLAIRESVYAGEVALLVALVWRPQSKQHLL